jgi:hypothetical protein
MFIFFVDNLGTRPKILDFVLACPERTPQNETSGEPPCGRSSFLLLNESAP